ncbi:MAG TPA: hypothetical protein VFC50_02905, partial [Candidatus Dormibacteraeota bacterium]|nr:hypothetical protein [Candidatus Dormibacteraeota bacterium]
IMYSAVLAAEQALDPSRDVKFIVPYPHSSNITRADETGQLETFLSVLTRASMHAGIVAWRNHPGSKLVLPGETLYDRSLPTTTDLMMSMAEEADVPKDALIPLGDLSGESTSYDLNNTYRQTEKLAEFFGDDTDSILWTTLRYHRARVARTLGAYSLPSEVAVAEDILHAEAVTEYDQYLGLTTQFLKGLGKTEALAWLMTIGNRQGAIPNLLMAHTGGRLVDVVPNGKGGLKMENKGAQAKQARLIREAGAAQRTKLA